MYGLLLITAVLLRKVGVGGRVARETSTNPQNL
jgi:hypothetical protein